MNIVDLIGNTPVAELRSFGGGRFRIMCKLEGSNPGGSVKDRIAREMILQAEKDGLLTPEKTILEPTSGNTGIGLAMVGAARGYRVRLTMPASVSKERKAVLEAFGAEIVLTPPQEGTDGAIRAAMRIFQQNPGAYYMPNQFANPANVAAHYKTTGPEIYRQTDGEVRAVVAGMGTTGTLMGISGYLKGRDERILIFGVEPAPGHHIQGLKNLSESIVPAIYDPSRIDHKVMVSDEEAFEMARQLALKEGIFAGMSSGAALAGALKVAPDLVGATIVVILPDRGDRYLSTGLFALSRSRCSEELRAI